MEIGPDSETEGICQPSLVKALPQQDLFSSDISHVPIQNIATDTIFYGPMETHLHIHGGKHQLLVCNSLRHFSLPLHASI